MNKYNSNKKLPKNGSDCLIQVLDCEDKIEELPAKYNNGLFICLRYISALRPCDVIGWKEISGAI